MNIKTAIEVQDWGDYDMVYTKCIMVSEFNVNVTDIVDE